MTIVPYEVVRGQNGDARIRGRRQGVQPAGDLRDDPAEAEGRRRGVPRRAGDRRGRSPCRPTSTTPSARPPRTPAASPASRSSASSTSPPRPRWPTGSTRRRTRRSSSSTSAAARSTCRCSRSATASSRCKSTAGDNHLGGDNFDKAIVDWMVDEFKRDQGIDLRNDKMALQRLNEAAEKAKIELSTTTSTTDQPAVHHGRRERAEAPRPAAHRAPSSRSSSHDLIERLVGPYQAGPHRRRASSRQDRRRRARRRHDPHAGRAGARQGADRARSPTRASTRTRSSPSARPSRAACSRATSRTCCCST